MDLAEKIDKGFKQIIEEFKKEFTEKESIMGVNFDFTYIVFVEIFNSGKNLNAVLPIVHSYETKKELTEFTKKIIEAKPKESVLKYLLAYEKLQDNTFKGFFLSVKDFSNNSLETKLYYTDNGRIVYETETTENELKIW